MAVDWNYTKLAAAYVNRPPYAETGIQEMLARAEIATGTIACDIGAGVGHLTIPLLRRELVVHAVEPNDAMRALGIERTAASSDAVTWYKGVAEATGLPSAAFDLVTFGSSFNVADRPRALQETWRLLKGRHWFACMWNHRDLDDPLQVEVEALIKRHVPGYDYGTRREDQTPVIRACGLFEEPTRFEARVTHRLPAEEWVNAWRSHVTLARQAGDRLGNVVDAIDALLSERRLRAVDVPYVTRIWMACGEIDPPLRLEDFPTVRRGRHHRGSLPSHRHDRPKFHRDRRRERHGVQHNRPSIKGLGRALAGRERRARRVDRITFR
jgi:SAM-dependent methyltransferase